MKIYLALILLQWSFVTWSLDVCDEGVDENLSNISAVLAKTNLSPAFCEAVQECYDLYAEEMAINHVTADKIKENPCANAENLWRDTKFTQMSRKIGTCGMSPEESIAIAFYSVSGFTCMNKFLWKQNGELTKTQVLVDALNSALKKLPQYKGIVRRGTVLPNSVKAQHTVGATVTYEAFTSSSTNRGYNSPDQFIILSATGRPIMGIAPLSYESEVLFPSKTKFKVLDVRTVKEMTYYTMKEVDPQAKASEEKALVKQLTLPQPESVSKWDTWSCPLDSAAAIPKEIMQTIIPILIDPN